jgi:hypothetical protein
MRAAEAIVVAADRVRRAADASASPVTDAAGSAPPASRNPTARTKPRGRPPDHQPTVQAPGTKQPCRRRYPFQQGETRPGVMVLGEAVVRRSVLVAQAAVFGQQGRVPLAERRLAGTLGIGAARRWP